MDPTAYIDRIPFNVLSRSPKPMPIRPDESGRRVVLRLSDSLRSDMHQNSRLLVQAPMLQRQKAGMVIAPQHCHDYYEISFVMQGALKNALPGGASMRLEAGDVMLIPPSATHSLYADADDSVMFNFMIESDYAEKLFYLHDLSSLSSFSRAQKSGIAESECLYCTGNTGRLWAIAVEILREYYTPDQFSDSMTDAFALPLLTVFESVCSSLQRCDNAIESAIRYIVNNPASASLETVAQRFGYSPDYLSRLMKQRTGRSFQQLRRSSMAEQAAYMLESTELPVSDVAHKVGVSNLTRFYKLFMSVYGCSPSEYRARHLPASKNK